jgi:hypothetical protein
LTDVSEELTASIIRATKWDIAPYNLAQVDLMMETVRTSVSSVNFYQTTWRNIPEGCHLQTRRREKLKSH